VQTEDRDRHGERALDLLEPLLDRLHRVLKRRVVELHDMRATRARVGKAAEIRMDDVEAAAAETEVLCLGVDHHLVPGLHRPGQVGIRDRRALLAVLEPDAQPHDSAVAGLHRRHGPPTQPQHPPAPPA
jgi:hypothetical protein